MQDLQKTKEIGILLCNSKISKFKIVFHPHRYKMELNIKDNVWPKTASQLVSYTK